MRSMSTRITLHASHAWTLPSRGVVGIACLIVAESAVFIIFVVAYIFYLGKSISGPTPREVLEVPIIGTICLLVQQPHRIFRGCGALRKNKVRLCSLWLAATVLLGGIFLARHGSRMVPAHL